MPAATAKKIWVRSRSTIQQLLWSYVRLKHGMPGVTSKATHVAVPSGAGPLVLLHRTCHLQGPQILGLL